MKKGRIIWTMLFSMLMPFCILAQPDNPSLEFLKPVPHLHKSVLSAEDHSQIKWVNAEDKFESRLLHLEKEVADLKLMIQSLIKSEMGSPVADVSNALPPKGEIAGIPSVIEIYFENGQSGINANALMALNEVIDIAAHYPTQRIILKGYADATGKPERNQALAQERMQQVRNLLLSSGIDNQNIFAQFPDSNFTEKGANMRKVSIVFAPSLFDF
jgi:outer membrane protein OmpA-like peptidoglycan-associated protein